MTLNNGEDDTERNTECCDNCGSLELVRDEVRGEVCCLPCGFVCADNELAMDGLEMTWGDSPQNTPSESVGGGSLPVSRPGDYSGSASDYRRRRKWDRRARFAPPRYIQSVARELEAVGVSKATIGRVHSILSEADSLRNEVPLADQRPPLKGYADLPEGKYEKSIYRKKALALAALAVDDSYGRPNAYRNLAIHMGVLDEDLVRLKKMISSRVPDRARARIVRILSSGCDSSEMARRLREEKLDSAIDHIHSFMHDIIIHGSDTPSGIVTALDIRNRAIQVLVESQEPVRGSPMGLGQYSSFSPHKAAMLATFEAIKSLGLPLEFCKELYRQVPVARMKTDMRRIASWWNRTDETESGDAAGHA